LTSPICQPVPQPPFGRNNAAAVISFARAPPRPFIALCHWPAFGVAFRRLARRPGLLVGSDHSVLVTALFGGTPALISEPPGR